MSSNHYASICCRWRVIGKEVGVKGSNIDNLADPVH